MFRGMINSRTTVRHTASVASILGNGCVFQLANARGTVTLALHHNLGTCGTRTVTLATRLDFGVNVNCNNGWELVFTGLRLGERDPGNG